MSEPRKKNGPATRQAILSAARKRFAAQSYEAVGLRDVARDAGIDVALVSRYFGLKEELFRKVLLERNGEEWFGGRKDVAGVAEWLAKLAIGEGGDTQDDLERLSIILRSASSDAAATAVRASFTADVFEPLSNLLAGPEAEARASLALSLVIGATVLRGVVGADQPGSGSRTILFCQIRQALLHLLNSSESNS